MTTRSFRIPAKGGGTTPMVANSVAVEEAASPFRLILDPGDKDAREYDLRQGHSVVGEPFTSIRLENDSDDPITVTLHFSQGEVKGVGQSTLLDIGTAKPQTASVPVGMEAVEIAPASTNRRALTIRNNGAVDLFIGGEGVQAGQGFPLAPGDTFETTVSGAAWFGVVSAGNCDVRVMEQS